MKVRATQMGYYKHQRRREGAEFSISSEKEFSKKWMEKVDQGPAQKDRPTKDGK